jgi:ubiquinone/menaquinone biosynthesis C-methylase UbiE
MFESPGAAYDVIADDYAARFSDEVFGRPVDLALLEVFTALVGRRGGTVLDVGCGPGTATAMLAKSALDVIGVDASAEMIRIAQERLPDIDFRVADFRELDLADESLAGICSWYSLVHTESAALPGVIAEFARMLLPGGWLLLAFQTEAPDLTLAEPFGKPVTLTYLRHDTGRVSRALGKAGLAVDSITVRQRDIDAGETANQAFVLARKAR